MLRQICRRQRLAAEIADREHQSSETSSKAAQLLSSTQSQPPAPDAKKSEMLPDDLYSLMLVRINAARSREGLAMLHDYRVLPHPAKAVVLSGDACPSARFPVAEKGWTFSTGDTHRGNSAVLFRTDTREGQCTGFITSFWSKEILGKLHSFAAVHPHAPLEGKDIELDPLRSFPGFRNVLLYTKSYRPLVLIEMSDIVGHAPLYVYPEGTFGIAKSTMSVHTYLARGRL
jgi:hypothetical protein